MKYYIKTFGCQMNFSDSERMKTFFEQNNFEPVAEISEADLIIFNTCGVRQMSEHKVYGHVHNVFKKDSQRKKIIIITGCLAHREEFRKRLAKKADLFIAIKDFPKILQLIRKDKNLLKKLKNENLKKESKQINKLPDYQEFSKSNDYLKITPQYERKNSALIPIMTGCDNFCTYCIVPYARGREWSRPFKEIETEIDSLYNNNCDNPCKEITLLGQNVNSYKDVKISFPVLLNTLAKKFPKNTFRFLTSHPKDYSDELIKIIAKNKNISRQIHLPVQAGSDKILQAMNRPYTQKHYLNLIEKTRKLIPDAKISTDVIVGFPGETEKDFQETVRVFKKVKFSEAFVNKYSPRPGTRSFNLKDDVTLNEKKRREQELKKYL